MAPKSKGKHKRQKKAKECTTLCRPAIVTKQGCICTSDVVHKKNEFPWCFVKCPAAREGAVRRDLLFRRWDEVPSVKTKKPKLVCLREQEYGTCKKGDAEKTERTTGALVAVLTALKLISSLYVKAQSTDAQTLHSLSLFHKRTVQDLVGRDALSKERGDELIRELSETIQKSEAGDAYKQILTTFRDALPAKEATPILDFIIDNVPAEDIGDFLRGGQLQFEDGGALYEKIKATQKAYPRFSSHHPAVKNAPHHAVNELLFDNVFHILGGQTADGKTWIQSESSPWPAGLTAADVFYSALQEPHYIRDMLDHGLDFVVHKLTHKNVGPYGSTERGEWNPIVLKEGLPKKRQADLTKSFTVFNPETRIPEIPAQNYLPTAAALSFAALPQIAGSAKVSEFSKMNVSRRKVGGAKEGGDLTPAQISACEDTLCANCLTDTSAFRQWQLKNYPDRVCAAPISGTPAAVEAYKKCYEEATERYRTSPIVTCVDELKKVSPKARFPIKCATCPMPAAAAAPAPVRQTFTPPPEEKARAPVVANNAKSITILVPTPDRPSCMSQYVKLKELGQGSFGQVLEVCKKDEYFFGTCAHKYALKISRGNNELTTEENARNLEISKKDPYFLRMLADEKLDGQYMVPRVYDAWLCHDEKEYKANPNDNLFVVLDRWDGDMLKYGAKAGNNQKLVYTKPQLLRMFRLLARLGQLGIAHADAKPDQFLYRNGAQGEQEISITDFGFSGGPKTPYPGGPKWAYYAMEGWTGVDINHGYQCPPNFTPMNWDASMEFFPIYENIMQLEANLVVSNATYIRANGEDYRFRGIADLNRSDPRFQRCPGYADAYAKAQEKMANMDTMSFRLSDIIPAAATKATAAKFNPFHPGPQLYPGPQFKPAPAATPKDKPTAQTSPFGRKFKPSPPPPVESKFKKEEESEFSFTPKAAPPIFSAQQPAGPSIIRPAATDKCTAAQARIAKARAELNRCQLQRQKAQFANEKAKLLLELQTQYNALVAKYPNKLGELQSQAITIRQQRLKTLGEKYNRIAREEARNPPNVIECTTERTVLATASDALPLDCVTPKLNFGGSSRFAK